MSKHRITSLTASLAALVLTLAALVSAPAATAEAPQPAVTAPPVTVIQTVAYRQPDPSPPRAAPLSAIRRVAAPKVVHRTVHKPRAHPSRRASRDVGILPSLYTGRYYDSRYEPFRRCVVKRESEGRYGARNGSGAAGAYQFMPSWLRTIQHWTKEFVPIYAMSRAAQDYAFWRALNHGKGIGNWAGGRWHC